MKILFCQISNKLINPKEDSISNEYYDLAYSKHKNDGYVRPGHFWEIPLWIAELSYIVEDKELHIVTNIKDSIEFIDKSNSDIILFSELDVNKHIIKEITDGLDRLVCVGGSRKEYENNVLYVNSIKNLCNVWSLKYKKGTDYSLFKNYETIPRLQLSTGCLHHCKFCTVGNVINIINENIVLEQVESFRDLNFKLIYIDDKTFGQSSNYRLLEKINIVVKKYNPNFNGFIIQTTAAQILKINITDLNIFAVELGVESYNDNILKSVNKPIDCSIINHAVMLLKSLHVNVITNILIGINGETEDSYGRTLNFLSMVRPYAMNIYNLVLYDNTLLAEESEILSEEKDENSVIKSYNTPEINSINSQFESDIYSLGMKQLELQQ